MYVIKTDAMRRRTLKTSQRHLTNSIVFVECYSDVLTDIGFLLDNAVILSTAMKTARDRILPSVMWSETVGLRTRPVLDQKIGLGLGLAGLVLC